MTFRMKIITPLGRFFTKTDDCTEEEWEELTQADVFKGPSTHLSILDENGNQIFFQEDLLRNSIIVLEANPKD